MKIVRLLSVVFLFCAAFFAPAFVDAATYYGSADGNWNATTTWQPAFTSKWGTHGSANGQFSGPQDIAADYLGNVYVADHGNSRVQKFDSSGNFILKWGSSGTGDGQFTSVTSLAVDSFGNVYVTDSDNNRVQKFDSSGNFVLKWGSSGTTTGKFSFPEGIAIDSANNVYVTDLNNDRVQKFDTSGNYVAEWGTSGSGDGQFSAPFRISTDSQGNVYVGDYNNSRVQKFDSSGNFILKWGSSGSGNGEFSAFYGIAVDDSGDVFVGEGGNRRVQKFDSSGNFLLKWGSLGTGNEQFQNPKGLRTDAFGHLYISDEQADRVQKFTLGPPTSGDLAVISGDVVLTADTSIQDLTIASGGSLDLAGHTLTILGNFTNDGTFTANAGTVIFSGASNVISGSSNTTFYNLTKSETSTSTIYFSTDSNATVTHNLTLDGVLGGPLGVTGGLGRPTFSSVIGSVGTGDGQFDTPHGIAIDSSGNMYISDTKNNRIQKFDSSGNFITKWGSNGTTEGKFKNPLGMSFDSGGNLWVADNQNNRIQEFDSSGNFIKMLGWGVATGANQFESCTSSCQAGIEGNADGQFGTPHDIKFDADGNFYVSNYFWHNVQKFDASGNYVSRFGTSGSGNGQIFFPDGLYVDSSGNIYVVDVTRLQKFDSSYNYVNSYQISPSQPHNVTVDSLGNFYISSNFDNTITVLSSSLVHLFDIADAGSGNGQFNQPYGMAFDPDNNLYIVDGLNNRVQKFTLAQVFTLDLQGTSVSSYLDVSNSIITSNSIGCETCTNSGGNTGWTFAAATTPTPTPSEPEHQYARTGGSSGGGWSENASLPVNTIIATTTTPTTSLCPAGFLCEVSAIAAPSIFNADLKFGAVGNGVKNLQKVLNSLGFTVSAKGAGSAGKETTYFGPATRAALIRFQKAKGIKPSVGYFGPITRAFVNAAVK
jgi:DNA-binding beta-propeller fold protein YncE